MAESEELKVAILIPTINNHEELSLVLDALSLQTWEGPIEVAVVSPSDDLSRGITQERGMTWIDDEGSRNRADACNVGIKALDCDILLFTDDDTRPPVDWVEGLVRWFDRKEVSGVGGPNFAPNSDPFWGKVSDVAFTARWVTAGTRYGKVPKGELVEIDHNPGCNSAYRKHVLDEIGGFEAGCIGAEDVVLDEKIRQAGYRLWFDPTTIMPHRRRNPAGPYMKQLRNYGYVRTLANARWNGLRSWAHTAIAFFPPLVILSLLSLTYGFISGGIDFNDPLNFPKMGLPRIAAHIPLTVIGLYLMISLLGGAFGNSPHRSFVTVIASPIYIFLAHWAYGMGVIRGWNQIWFGGGAAAGLGIQIDDRDRD